MLAFICLQQYIQVHIWIYRCHENGHWIVTVWWSEHAVLPRIIFKISLKNTLYKWNSHFFFNFEYRLHEIFQFIHTLTTYIVQSSKVVPIFVSHKNLYLVDLRSEIYADPQHATYNLLQNKKYKQKNTFVGWRANLCRPPSRRAMLWINLIVVLFSEQLLGSFSPQSRTTSDHSRYFSHIKLPSIMHTRTHHFKT